jgi:hypothetical protein
MVITLAIIGALIKCKYSMSLYSVPRLLYKYTNCLAGFGESKTSGIYGTIAVIFLFHDFCAFSITPMTSLYPTEVNLFKLRTIEFAIFRM